MKKAIQIYVKRGTDLTRYGFAKSDYGWSWRCKNVRSGLCVERSTMRLSPFLAYTSASVAVVIAMAKDNALVVDNGDEEARYSMRLTYEEMCAVEAMRGHPITEPEITDDDVKTDNNGK